jgi:glycolate oxidase FAD binding subunit
LSRAEEAHGSQLTAHGLFEPIVGREHVWEATPEDAIDGVQPALVVEPGSVEEASAILQVASELRLAVAPRGGGTKLGWGNVPERLDLILSTRRLNRVLEHAAGDLVVRVEAGALLEDVQRELAGTGQWLALDPPQEGATIGGIIAANASGPHRLRYGTARDLLIGITYILPDGTIARSGGKVVKNVAGYDLGKLFTGSLGTLGLIAEAIFRLHPLPQASRTVLRLHRRGDIQSLCDTVQDILRSNLVPSVLDFSWSRTLAALALRLEGVGMGVEEQYKLASALMDARGAGIAGGDEEEELFRQSGSSVLEMARPDPSNEATYLKISYLPPDLPAIFQGLMEASEDKRLHVHVYGHAASGVARVALSPIGAGKDQAATQVGADQRTPAPARFDPSSGENDQLALIRELRERIVCRGGGLVIQEAPLRVKQEIDVWGDVGTALPLMRRVKERFDPNRIMNPGRFVGGI